MQCKSHTFILMTSYILMTSIQNKMTCTWLAVQYLFSLWPPNTYEVPNRKINLKNLKMCLVNFIWVWPWLSKRIYYGKMRLVHVLLLTENLVPMWLLVAKIFKFLIFETNFFILWPWPWPWPWVHPRPRPQSVTSVSSGYIQLRPVTFKRS